MLLPVTELEGALLIVYFFAPPLSCWAFLLLFTQATHRSTTLLQDNGKLGEFY